MLGCAWSLRLKLHWVGKKTLFKRPFGTLLRWLGGISVDRSEASNQVAQIAQQIRDAPEMYLAMAPSGTRKKRDHWKSGFYRIALEADVPVICGFLDYKRKAGGLGPTIKLSGNMVEDMDRFREFFGTVAGKYPDKASEPRLRGETE